MGLLSDNLVDAARAVGHRQHLDTEAFGGSGETTARQVVVGCGSHSLRLRGGSADAHGHGVERDEVGGHALATALIDGLDGKLVGLFVEVDAARAIVLDVEVVAVVERVGHLGEVLGEVLIHRLLKLIHRTVDIETVKEFVGGHIVAVLGGEVEGKLHVAIAIALLIGIVFGEERRIGLARLVGKGTDDGLVEQREIEHLLLAHVKDEQTVGSHLSRSVVDREHKGARRELRRGHPHIKEVEVFHRHGAGEGIEVIVVERVGAEVLWQVEGDGIALTGSPDPVVAHIGHHVAEVVGVALPGHVHHHHLARGVGEAVIERITLRREAVGERYRLVGEEGELHMGIAESRPLLLVVDHGHDAIGDHTQ